MSNKKINPDNLSRVNGSFKDMSGELEHNVSDLISSSATEKLQAATDGIKKLSKEMVATISSLAEYLGAVGEAFRSAAASMAPNKISFFMISIDLFYLAKYLISCFLLVFPPYG